MWTASAVAGLIFAIGGATSIDERTPPAFGPRGPRIALLAFGRLDVAVGAAKQGNDPYNQEIGLCTLQDYGRTSSSLRDTLLLVSAQNTAGHIKYGDQFEPYRRFAEAFGIATDSESADGDDPAEAMLDDIESEIVNDAGP